MISTHSRRLGQDLVLPTLLFAALGGMTWAVRGCSGYGGMDGCLFAGVTWGAAWWFISRQPGPRQSRRYTSGWIILAVAAGVAVSGNRGWMQWPSFFDGRLQTNTPKGQFAPLSPAYGYLWLFIAGVPWAGIGACLLAWCASGRPLRARDWALRLACAFAGAALGRWLFNHFPDLFLPLHQRLAAEYANLQAHPNLGRLIRDNGQALTHLGFYLGCLAYEAGRRDWKNVILILTVGLVNGAGWATLRNWSWANHLWPTAHFNFWRCWESSAGISIGVAYGIAYFLVNQPLAETEQTELGPWLGHPHPNAERIGAYLGLWLGLGISIKNGLKGWANIYVGNESYWNAVLWRIIGPLLILGVIALLLRVWRRPLPRGFAADAFPRAYRWIWLVLITQNVLAQLITGPWTAWNEVAFSLYYLLLFLLSGVIVHHLHCLRALVPVRPAATAGAAG
ncbi:MAG: hypothetical protein KGS61_05360 [Verrucomicrobia bacterium]|nr:hypothetical protein [Verrucomicrobiota bacterium]